MLYHVFFFPDPVQMFAKKPTCQTGAAAGIFTTPMRIVDFVCLFPTFLRSLGGGPNRGMEREGLQKVNTKTEGNPDVIGL